LKERYLRFENEKLKERFGCYFSTTLSRGDISLSLPHSISFFIEISSNSCKFSSGLGAKNGGIFCVKAESKIPD
jgi:hypothetical protein